jgi:hypothetical protein
VALVPLDHIRREGSAGVPVAGEVDIDELLDFRIGRVKDGIVVSDPGVIDEDGGGAELGANLVRYGVDGIAVRDVALEVQRCD